MKVTIERGLQAFQIAAIIFVIGYLLTYVSGQRQISQCQTTTNAALITSVSAARDAARIESNGMNTLVSGLLSEHPDARGLLQAYQTARAQADSIRVDNPLPSGIC